MRIKSISFRNVGPFGAEGVKLDGFTMGLNVVCETNEFGKSTVLKALEMILFKPFSSTDKHIKALRTANSEDAPEGEITFSSEGKDYRFSKRFLKSKGAHLQDMNTGEELAVDRAAEEVLAKLLRSDKFEGGPSGLLWVRQGMSMEGITDNGQIASRLEGELGTLIGGERAREYLTRVEVELSEVLTPRGQEKKGGPLRNAREAVEATQAELIEAKRLRDMTTSIGVELSKVSDEIEQLSGEAGDENLAEQIDSTREAMTAARSFADALALLEAQHVQIIGAAERAADRQRDHISALVNYNDTTAQLTAVQSTHQLEASKLKEMEGRRADLRKNVDELDSRREEFIQTQARRDSLTRQTQRLEILQNDMQHLRACLDQFKSLEDEQSKLTDQISDLPILTRTDVETLRRAANEVRQCEMELATFSTHLYIELSTEGSGKVTLDGDTLQTGPIELLGGASLSLEGIGTLRSDNSRLRETKQRVDRARLNHSGLLDRLKVEDTAEASKFADQREVLEADRKQVTADMGRLAPEGRTAMETDFTASETEARQLAETVEDAQTELGEANDTDVLESLRTERAKFEVVEEALNGVRQRLAKSETEQARLRERLRGLNLPEEETARIEQADTLAGEKLKTDADVRAIAAQVVALKSKAPEQPLDMLSARLTRLQQIAGQSRQRLETLKTKAAGLQARRDAAFEGGDAEATVASLEARLETQQSTLSRHIRGKDVRILLRDTLVVTQTRLRDAYTAPVTQELAPLLSRVIPGAEAGLGDSLGVDTVLRDGKVEKIGQLSGGTQEQFAILTRLAYARLLARSGASAPVILDDALVYADDARRDAMFDVLGLVSSGEMPIQIVYLSCHAGATARLGGTRITPQPW